MFELSLEILTATAAGASILSSNGSRKAKRTSYARVQADCSQPHHDNNYTRRPIVEHEDDFVHVVPLNDALVNQDHIFPPCHDR